MPKSVPKSGDRSGPCRRPSDGARKRKRGPSPSSPYRPVDRAATGKRICVPTTMESPTGVSSTTPDTSPTAGRAAATDFMLAALGRIRELQDELDFLQNDPYAEDTDDEGDQPGDGRQPAQPNVIGGRQAEAMGWAVCARETMHFLQREGIPPDSPLMVNLRRRLVGRLDEPDEGLSC
ncbi:uncharacterized protein LOC118507049 [Anopheles stephensi]|uniref:uncharacterized protein LOC118507049 n=1 Tax=Anopheles stephensi TaxID=30069 RepID=UPI001658AC1E|nr:uncharacterized protein LOC118507049 [Anopheles stephensi]XP_035900903.1 uncharacterized protein LOC118507049 [Anopheles stephensi]